MTQLIETHNLSCHFGGVKAVDLVNFALREGEVRALIGPNGAGKSTLVSLLCGRLQPTAGTISYLGRDITHLPAHQRVQLGIAYTFQITSVFENLSCFENVRLAAQSADVKRGQLRQQRAIDQTVIDVLVRVGLTEYVETIARQLSYGHQRLLEVAMGLALQPRLLMLDEPTQGLSDPEIADFIALIREISESTTILLIEHNMDVVMELAETITVLESGRILAEGAPDSIRADKAVQHAYLGQ